MSRLGFQISVVAALTLATTLTANSAPMPVGVGGLELRQGRDSLVAAAARLGYSVSGDQGTWLAFTSPDSTAASIQVELQGGKACVIHFQYPGIPVPDDFASKEQEFIGRFGAPSGASDQDSSRVVGWQQDWARLVLRAGFSVRAPRPCVARFSDLAVTEEDKTPAKPPAKPPGKPAGKSLRKPNPKAGHSK